MQQNKRKSRDRMEVCFAHKLVTNTYASRINTSTKGNSAGQPSDLSMHTQRERTTGGSDCRGGGRGGENQRERGRLRDKK